MKCSWAVAFTLFANCGFDLAQAGLDAHEAGGELALKKQGADDWRNDKYADEGDANVADPVWQDANLDDNPEVSDPVCVFQGLKRRCSTRRTALSGANQVAASTPSHGMHAVCSSS